MPGIGSNKNNPLHNFPDLVTKSTVVSDNTRVVLPIQFKNEPFFKDDIALKAVKNSSFSPVAKICEQKMAIPDPVELINEFKKFTESTSNGPRILTSKAREMGKLMDKVLADPKARASLIKYFGLDSEAAMKTLLVLATREAGHAGHNNTREDHVFPIMVEIINRGISHNIVKAITSKEKEFTPTTLKNLAIRDYTYSPEGSDSNIVKAYNNKSADLDINRKLMDKVLKGECRFERQVTVNGKKTMVDTDASKIFYHQGTTFGTGNDVYEEERTDGREHNFAKTFGKNHGLYYLQSLGFPSIHPNAALKYDKSSY